MVDPEIRAMLMKLHERELQRTVEHHRRHRAASPRRPGRGDAGEVR